MLSNRIIRCEVLALQPLTLVHAIGLAKIQEEKYSDLRGNYKPYTLSSSSVKPIISSSLIEPTKQTPLLPKPKQTLTVKRLTPTDL